MKIPEQQNGTPMPPVKPTKEKRIMSDNRDCEKCIHRVPYLDKDEGVWRASCEVFSCQFLDRNEVLNAYMGREK